MSRVIHFGQNPEAPRVVRFGGRAGAGAPGAAGTLSTPVVVDTGRCEAYNAADTGQRLRPAFANSAWYVVGFDVDGDKLRIWKSSDLTTWTEQATGHSGNNFVGYTQIAIAVAADDANDYILIGFQGTSGGFRLVYDRSFNAATDAWDKGSGNAYNQFSAFASPDPVTLDAAVLSDGTYSLLSYAARESETLARRRRSRFNAAGTEQGAAVYIESGQDPQIAALAYGADDDVHEFYNSDVDATSYYRHNGGADTDLGFLGAPIAAVAISTNRVACLFRDEATGFLRLVITTTAGAVESSTASTIVCRGAAAEMGHAVMAWDGADVLRVLYMSAADAMREATFTISTTTWADLGAVTDGVDFEVGGLTYADATYVLLYADRTGGDGNTDLMAAVHTPA